MSVVKNSSCRELRCSGKILIAAGIFTHQVFNTFLANIPSQNLAVLKSVEVFSINLNVRPAWKMALVWNLNKYWLWPSLALQHSKVGVLWGAAGSAVRFGKSLLGKGLKYLAPAKLCCWVQVLFSGHARGERWAARCTAHKLSSFAFPLPGLHRGRQSCLPEWCQVGSFEEKGRNLA